MNAVVNAVVSVPESNKNLVSGVRGELVDVGHALICQTELANRLSDLVEGLDGDQHRLARDLAHGLHSALILMSASLERVTGRLGEIEAA